MARKDEVFWAATHIEWDSVEDSYEEGELSNSRTVLSETIFIKAATPAALIEKLASTYGLPERFQDAWSAFDGRLNCDFLVDDDDQEATPRDVTAWHTGRKRLWSAHVSVVVAHISMPDTSEIAEAFEVEDMGGAD